MSSKIRQLIVWLALWLGCAQLTNAGTILLSGDINIGNFIDGSSGVYINPGNAQFFRNVLGSGTKVLIHNEGIGYYIGEGTSGETAVVSINDLYNSLGGVISTRDYSRADITSERLSGVDLYFEMFPRHSYSQSEITAVQSFLQRSGTIFFVGEHNLLAESNSFINQSLSALGSSMRLGNNTIFELPHPMSTNINVDPLTAGILSFSYATTNTVSGGKSLIQTTDDRTFIARETIGASTVPEPSTFIIWATGSVAVSFFGARRRNRGPLANHRQHRESDG